MGGGKSVSCVNNMKYILTFVDSVELKYIMPLILRKNEVFFKNTCAGLKNVVILHPQSGNDAAQK